MMRIILKYSFVLMLFISCWNSFSQVENVENTAFLSYEEFIGYVKKHHPVMKQANLKLSSAEANVLKSRGGFDPKIEVDYNTKEFKDTDYFDLFNATFKVPTWYGVEFKANFEDNSGVFLNPQNDVPDEGLYSAGVSIDALEGFLINKRMATLKKSKVFLKQTKADRELLINELLYNATLTYFDWIKAANEQKIYETFLENAATRFKATKRGVETGDKAPIDSTESKIAMQTRALNLEASRLKRIKASFKASNFLWLNEIPLEIQQGVLPLLPNKEILETSLQIEDLVQDVSLVDNHPKIQSLNYKIEGLTIDKRLKVNKLLPKLNLNYNFISSTPDQIDTFNNREFKAGATFSTPLFLRKERGDVKLAKFKLQEANFERAATSLEIKNKIETAYAEIESLDKQNVMATDLVANYQTMLTAEERKFFLGESSLFLINSRESKLIDVRLKQNELQIKLLNTRAKLFNSLGITPSNL